MARRRIPMPSAIEIRALADRLDERSALERLTSAFDVQILDECHLIAVGEKVADSIPDFWLNGGVLALGKFGSWQPLAAFLIIDIILVAIGHLSLSLGQSLLAGDSLAQAHTASPGLAGRILADQLDTCAFKRCDDLDQRFHDTPHLSVRRFHPLDRGKRYVCQFRQSLLVDAEQGSRRAHLLRGDHAALMTYKTSYFNLTPSLSICYTHANRKFGIWQT